MRELIEYEDEVKNSKRRLEQGGVYEELDRRFRLAIPTPIRPRIQPTIDPAMPALSEGSSERAPWPCHSPDSTPLPPRIGGPVEFPVLAEGDNKRQRQNRCHRCRCEGHHAKDCTQPRRVRKCAKCRGNHRTRKCPTPSSRGKMSADPSTASAERPPLVDVGPVEQMTLLERLELLDRKEWTPPSCSKCGKQDPQHKELECPRYEKCLRCHGWGAYGFVRRHPCCPVIDEDEVSLVEEGQYEYDDGVYPGTQGF